jgi:hypothetical protein
LYRGAWGTDQHHHHHHHLKYTVVTDLIHVDDDVFSCIYNRAKRVKIWFGFNWLRVGSIEDIL